MRFGLDGTPFEQKKAGVGHYTLQLARSLAAIAPAHDFEIISPDCFSLDSTELDQSLSNLHFVSAGVNGVRRRGWWSMTLPRYCSQASFALFHGTNYELPYWSKCPTVLTIHDLSLLLFPHTHEKRLVRRARLKLPLMARRADAIITPSEAVKREVCEHLGVETGKVFAIPEAARAAFYRVPRAESDPVRKRLGIEDEFILFVGTIEPRKNLIILVCAFEELLRNTSLRPQLVIAGKEGWLSAELTAYLSSSPITDRVLFTGHLSDDDLRALYSSCRVFVYPSLYEGFGLPLLEAMMCGAPVITSNVPSIIETVGDAALLISPADVSDIARALKRMLEDDNEREHLSAAGMEHAKTFSWTKTASTTFDLYQEVIATKQYKITNQ
jgi:glycosyltransferase involved in cell wall biosynthesis